MNARDSARVHESASGQAILEVKENVGTPMGHMDKKQQRRMISRTLVLFPVVFAMFHYIIFCA